MEKLKALVFKLKLFMRSKQIHQGQTPPQEWNTFYVKPI
jgi:hypothetical protein